ncbi:MAG: ParA family protein [Verrucomicrobiota bacterium]
MEKNAPKVVAIANQKGGVGKTTTAINLAACLAEFDRNVLVVDMDPQANATSGLGLEQENGTSLYRALIGEGSIHRLVRETLVSRVHIIPSELDLAGAEVEIARSDAYLHRCSKALTPAIEDGRYNYIIIDCPPSLGILTMNALAAAHTAMLPIQSEYYALEGLSVISRLIRQLNENRTNPGLCIEGILLTMFDKRTNLSSQVVEEVRRHFNEKVYDTVIPRNVRLSEAPSYGMPIVLYDRNSAGSKAYMAMTEEFLRRNGDRPE